VTSRAWILAWALATAVGAAQADPGVIAWRMTAPGYFRWAPYSAPHNVYLPSGSAQHLLLVGDVLVLPGLRAVDARTGAQLWEDPVTLWQGHAVTAAGPRLVVATGGRLLVWDLATGQRQGELELPGPTDGYRVLLPVHHLILTTPDPDRVIVYTRSGLIRPGNEGIADGLRTAVQEVDLAAQHVVWIEQDRATVQGSDVVSGEMLQPPFLDGDMVAAFDETGRLTHLALGTGQRRRLEVRHPIDQIRVSPTLEPVFLVDRVECPRTFDVDTGAWAPMTFRWRIPGADRGGTFRRLWGPVVLLDRATGDWRHLWLAPEGFPQLSPASAAPVLLHGDRLFFLDTRLDEISCFSLSEEQLLFRYRPGGAIEESGCRVSDDGDLLYLVVRRGTELLALRTRELERRHRSLEPIPLEPEDRPDAIQRCRQHLEVDPGSWTARLALGRALARAGEWEGVHHLIGLLDPEEAAPEPVTRQAQALLAEHYGFRERCRVADVRYLLVDPDLECRPRLDPDRMYESPCRWSLASDQERRRYRSGDVRLYLDVGQGIVRPLQHEGGRLNLRPDDDRLVYLNAAGHMRWAQPAPGGLGSRRSCFVAAEAPDWLLVAWTGPEGEGRQRHDRLVLVSHDRSHGEVRWRAELTAPLDEQHLGPERMTIQVGEELVAGVGGDEALHCFDLEQGQERRIPLPGQFRHLHCRAGRRVVVEVWLTGERPARALLLDIDTGEHHELPYGSLRGAVWRPDDRPVALWVEDGGTLVAQDLADLGRDPWRLALRSPAQRGGPYVGQLLVFGDQLIVRGRVEFRQELQRWDLRVLQRWMERLAQGGGR
jgi:hypothetical protein